MHDRPTLLALALLTACGSAAVDDAPLADIGVRMGEPAVLPAERVAPPGTMTLSSADDFIPGTQVQLDLQGAPARVPVFLIGSLANGGNTSCPAQLAPLCLNLFNPIYVLGTGRSNAAGQAQFILDLPPNLPLVTAHLQAAARTPIDNHTSNVFDATFQAPVDTDTDTDSGGPPVNHCLARVDFVGTVATVVGAPFGSSSAVLRTTAATGSFQYDICLGDQDVRTTVGEYDHVTTGAFVLDLPAISVQVTGSPRPVVTVQDFPTPDVFRFSDGPQFADPTARVMSTNGVPDADMELWISITDGSGTSLTSDSPPAVFPFTGIAGFPHTFSLDDGDGTVLLQLTSMVQTLTPTP